MSETVHAKCQCGYEYKGLLYDCPVKCPQCGKLLLSVDREKKKNIASNPFSALLLQLKYIEKCRDIKNSPVLFVSPSKNCIYACMCARGTG